jgi:hypothetical protein
MISRLQQEIEEIRPNQKKKKKVAAVKEEDTY